MSDEQNNGSKVIGHIFSYPIGNEKDSWWGRTTWHTKMQIFVLLALLGPLPSAMLCYARDQWSRSADMWLISFFLMFLMWALEYRKRLDTDNINAYK